MALMAWRYNQAGSALANMGNRNVSESGYNE